MVNLYLNLSTCYANLSDHLTAAEIMKKAFAICNDNCPSLLKMAVYQESGAILLLQGNYEKSKDHFLKSYEQSIKYSRAEDHFANLIGLAQVYTSLNLLDSAEKYLTEAEQIFALGSDFKYEMSVVYSELASSYVNQKNFEKATFYLLKYKSSNDSIFNQRLTTNLMKIEAGHIEKESKAKIETQNKILALNEDIIERQKYLNIFIGIVAVLLIALAIVLLRNNRQKQRINHLLDQRVRERTQELQLNRDALHRAFQEREILITTTAARINTSLATLKGLCLLGSNKAEDARDYLEKVATALDDIRHIVGRAATEGGSRSR
jgi:tetratricopeptide (TPR) repeat protein